MRASAMTAGHRAARTTAMRRALAAIGPRAIVRNGSTAMIAPPAKSVPTRHAAATAIVARRRAFPTGSSATRSPMPRATAMARSGRSSRAAKVFAKTVTGRVAIVLTATVRKASENLAATRSFRAAHRIAVRARISEIDLSAAIPSRGRSAMRARATMRVLPVRRAMARGISTSRALTNRVTTSPASVATSARVFRSRVKIAPSSIVRSLTVLAKAATTARSSIVRVRSAMPGRSIRATKRDHQMVFQNGRAATTRTTARFSPSARRSGAVAPIASAAPRSAVRRRVRRGKEIRRAHRQGGVAGGPGFAP